MITGNYFTDNEGLKFIFEKGLRWDAVVPLAEKDFADAKKYQESQDSRYEFAPNNVAEAVENYKMVAESMGDLAGNYITPVSKEIDHEGLKLENGQVVFPEKMVKVIQQVIEAGVMPYAIGREFGGLHLPFHMHALILEILAAANPALCITVGCYNLAEVIEMFASEELKEQYLPRMAQGEMIGAMALTEPDFGSNLPEVQTRATQDENGNWKLNGTKIFITHGCGFKDTPAAILTLARSGDSKGAKGLSFFLVESTDIEVVRIEEKLGLHCSPTCQIAYEDSPAKLIGQTGMGLVRYSMAMMNGARLAVGAQALGIAQRGYWEAKKYASERIQFGKLIQEIPAVARLLDNMEMEVMASRALLYEAAYYVDMLRGLGEKLIAEGKSEKEAKRDPEVKKVDKVAKLLTPLIKLYASEKAVEVSDLALQVFGGSGYTEEYDAATVYRDARITTIYEGTSQLQVVAAIGGVVEGLGGNGVFSQYLEETLNEVKNLPDGIREAARELKDLVVEFKKKDKEEKDRLAWDLVWNTVYVLNAILLYRQAGLDGAPENFKTVADRYAREVLAKAAYHKAKLAA